MLINIVIAMLLIVLTTAIHTGAMLLALRFIRKYLEIQTYRSRWSHIHQVGLIVLLMFFTSLMEVLVWALTFLFLGAIEGFEPALYYSMVTFTTLGYGDVLLVDRWRLLGSFEAAIGIIMFGWTTAIVIAAVQGIYFRKGPDNPRVAG